MMFSHMRIARPVTDLARACTMYSQGLELQRIADFTDHAGFSGIMVGRPELAWHIEFTHCHDHPRQPAPTDEDLLVLYYPDKAAWQQACARMTAAGFRTMRSFNPYWDTNGKTFVDDDGYRVVLQNRDWP
ncbi:VOC family protein [Raoultella ornithinolytica]|uniref:VOC family protein n=2 Tax=Klebsiella/Raoultella group TaxID=2890311 RepID=A0A9Q9JGD6_RAOOR|nr:MULTISPECIES: VOC family protein [Raoultella]MBD9718741.1 VOC family protein [Raoultella sp. RLT01]HDX8330674.1 VOC family protein [Raoultella ornithinolytica CD1_MRS_4]EJD6654591.1 VOC family protein [Raoultella ornithinolytica]EJG2380208.1 VOC family protein [Raoultella ornithinolytica]EKQ7999505.1 VOC family protein [Raoultella ornithinolytica]